MKYDVWFTKPGYPDNALWLIGGIEERKAQELVEALNDEYPDSFFWKE